MSQNYSQKAQNSGRGGGGMPPDVDPPRGLHPMATESRGPDDFKGGRYVWSRFPSFLTGRWNVGEANRIAEGVSGMSFHKRDY